MMPTDCRRAALAALLLCLILIPASLATADRGESSEVSAAAADPNVAAADPNVAAADPNDSVTDPNQTDPNRVIKGKSDDDTGGFGKYTMLVPIGLLLLLFVFMGRKPRKEQKKREEMLANLKKGDKITSIGGIVGTVVEVRDAEITVKVDESSNTRMKFARWAVRSTGGASEHEADKAKD